MAKYKKRSDGRYESTVYLGRRDNGTKILKHLYAPTIKELEIKRSDVLSALDKGIYADDKEMTFGPYAEKWLLTYKQGQVAHGTYRNYKDAVKRLDGIKDIRLMKITKSDIQAVLKDMTDENKRMSLLVVKQVLDTAIDDGLIYRNVAQKIKSPAVKKQYKRRPLTDQERKAIRECDFEDMEQAFIDILFYTGVRREEALALTWNDINFNKCTLSINRALTYENNNKPHIDIPKSEKSIRSINMPSALNTALLDYKRKNHCLYLFHSISGNVMPYSTYRRFWKRIFSKINIKLGGTDDIKATDITPHFFRHNYATMLYKNGVDVKEAQRLLGHSSIKITLDLYTHLAEDDKDELKTKLDSFAI